MVVWGHFELICRVCYQAKDPVITIFDDFESLWVVFFMPAFFFITGFCTGFDKPFKPFLITGIRTILIPAMIIGYGVQLFDYMFMDVSWLWIVKTITKSVLTNASGEWFISSLFLARFAVWGINKLKNRYLQIAIAAVSFVLGLILMNSFENIREIWYFKHAMMALLFMQVGKMLKGYDGPVYKYSLVYIPVIIIYLALGFNVPYLTNRVWIPYNLVPLYLILSFLGIFCILKVSKIIDHSIILEYLGRNSLVIFLSHFAFYRMYIYLSLPYLNMSPSLTVVLIITVYTANVLSCCAIAYLLNTKPLRWILGK